LSQLSERKTQTPQLKVIHWWWGVTSGSKSKGGEVLAKEQVKGAAAFQANS